MSATLDVDIHTADGFAPKAGKGAWHVWVELLNDEHEATLWFPNEMAEEHIDRMIAALNEAKGMVKA